MLCSSPVERHSSGTLLWLSPEHHASLPDPAPLDPCGDFLHSKSACFPRLSKTQYFDLESERIVGTSLIVLGMVVGHTSVTPTGFL